MNWSLVGWVVIAISAILLTVMVLLFKKGISYPVRRNPAIEGLIASRISAIEMGQRRQVVLGHQLWSRVNPGLGLHSLAVLPTFLDPETGMDGGMTVSGGDGSLAVFARQIIKNRYRDGFLTALHDHGVRSALPGPTPLSFTAGFLPELHAHPHASLAVFGDYGAEAALWVDAVTSRGGYVFAAAGSLASQAALYASVRDLLIGEEVFLTPGLLAPDAINQAGWLTEDILRSLLILLLITAAILKMIGVL